MKLSDAIFDMQQFGTLAAYVDFADHRTSLSRRD